MGLHLVNTETSDALNINTYKKDGFVKVADVEHYVPSWVQYARGNVIDRHFSVHNGVYNDPYNIWNLTNQNEDVLYDNHGSWVYMIVDGETIVKIGETGNPLGIRTSRTNQPLKGTKCRFGRLISHRNDVTDQSIRDTLVESVNAKRVSLWALKCDYVKNSTYSVAGNPITLNSTVHKDLELQYINHIKEQTGERPLCNKADK